MAFFSTQLLKSGALLHLWLELSPAFQRKNALVEYENISEAKGEVRSLPLSIMVKAESHETFLEFYRRSPLNGTNILQSGLEFGCAPQPRNRWHQNTR